MGLPPPAAYPASRRDTPVRRPGHVGFKRPCLAVLAKHLDAGAPGTRSRVPGPKGTTPGLAMPNSNRNPNGAFLPRRAATGDRPRVLFLSCHLPWPPLSGGRRRELELIGRLSARFAIRLLVVSKTPDEDESNVEALAPFCETVDVFPAQPVAAGRRTHGAPYQVLRHRSPPASRRVREIIAEQRVDLVHVEGFYLMQHVPEWVEVPVLLVEQNIEYELARQRAHASTERVARLDSLYDCLHTQAAERACWRRATRLAAVTWEDR